MERACHQLIQPNNTSGPIRPGLSGVCPLQLSALVFLLQLKAKVELARDITG